jgi:osmotically-inducible protein OsmY
MYRKISLALLSLALTCVLMGCGGSPKEGGGSTPPPSASTASSAEDSKLQTDVTAKLKAEASLKDAKIEVKVTNGQVILEGSVKKPEEKDKAEEVVNEAIKDTKGAGVVNDIQIAE